VRRCSVRLQQRWLSAVGLGALCLALVGFGQPRQATFSHAAHIDRTTCSTCHSGVVREDSTALYPPPSQCSLCHDGATEPTVEYTPPPPLQTTLIFSHATHPADLQCRYCHVNETGEVEQAQPATCFECHAGTPETHQTDTDCEMCHRF